MFGCLSQTKKQRYDKKKETPPTTPPSLPSLALSQHISSNAISLLKSAPRVEQAPQLEALLHVLVIGHAQPLLLAVDCLEPVYVLAIWSNQSREP